MKHQGLWQPKYEYPMPRVSTLDNSKDPHNVMSK